MPRHWSDADDGTEPTDDQDVHEAPEETDVPEVLLIDLSSLIHPIYHMSATEPDPDYTSKAAVARVHALASNAAHVAVCCDGPHNLRKQIDPTYKANRPEREETLAHQIRLAEEQLARDGFPVWKAEGYEADDLIGTAVRLVRERNMARENDDALRVLIASSDKDLLQLVTPFVSVKSLRDGTVYDAAAVKAKFGIFPDQMVDYLSLIGDVSDNIKGAKGIGPTRARALLEVHGSLRTFYEKLEAGAVALTPGAEVALKEFRSRWPDVSNLISLFMDAPIPFDQLFQPRVSEAAKTFAEETMTEDTTPVTPEPEPLKAAQTAPEPTTAPPLGIGTITQGADLGASQQRTLAQVELLPPAPTDYSMQLDPRSLAQAKQVAVDLHNSRMFSAYGSPQAVLATIMVGRELGLPAMASLRMIHNIEGKHSLSAALVVSLVLKSGLALYFRPVEISATQVTFETLRKGKGNKPVTLTHTIEMAQTAGVVKPKSGWERNPTDMLVARCSVRLARLVYPDVAGGLYTPEELQDAREAVSHE
jgi:5'-3' exonuclease